MDSRVELYHDKLLSYIKFMHPRENIMTLSTNNNSVRKVLKRIIDLNKDYLLTDSYLFFIVLVSTCNKKETTFKPDFHYSLYQRLNNLTLDNITIIKDFLDFNDCIEYANDRYNYPDYVRTYATRVKYLLEPEYVDLEHYFNNSMCSLVGSDFFTETKEDKLIVRFFLKILFCYCIVNNRINDFNNLVDEFCANITTNIQICKCNGVKLIDNYNVNIDNMIICALKLIENKKSLIK